MKRKALLAINGCTPKYFETLSARDHLPFPVRDARWSDYTMKDALELRILMDIAASSSLDNARKVAGNALGKIFPIQPFWATDGQELWAALIHYDWPDAPDGWDGRMVVAGRWADIEAEADNLRNNLAPNCRVISIHSVSLTKAALSVWQEAREFGLPEAEEIQGPPEDLTGFPKWFQDCEQKRRALLREISSDIDHNGNA